jgi:chromosome segregation ATPase
MDQLIQAKAQLATLKEAEEKTKATIQEIQQKIDESAKEMASQNAEHKRRKWELKVCIGM